ncbi:hypothetical protein [Aquipseudomonas alcaligenes]|uniref:hypothetical protein n=1 Tax=Aquipseudomonas alcaligenes TaxID=43263 RepID=UPI00364E810B
MKNETFTPERIKAEADAFFEWDGEDRRLVTTTSCLLFAQHIAGLMQARSAQPAPVVPEGWRVFLSTADCLRDGDRWEVYGPKGGGIVSTHDVRDWTVRELLDALAAAPAQGQQVDHTEQSLGMAQHARDSAELRRLCAERDEAKRQVAVLRQHKTDYMEAAEGTRKALEAELSALKAQQAGQERRDWPDDAIVEAWNWCEENGGTPAEFLSHSLLVKRSRVLGRPLTWREAIELTALTTDMSDDQRDKLLAMDDAAPQPAPAQDVAGLLEWAVDRWHAEVANRPLQNVHRRSLDDTWRQVIRKLGGDAGLLCGPAHDALAAHDKQSGGEV